MDQQLAEISVAALGDSDEPGLSPGRHLSRDATEPSRQIPPARECLAIADRGDQRSCIHRADPRYRGQSPCRPVLASPANEFRIQFVDTSIQFLPLSAHIL